MGNKGDKMTNDSVLSAELVLEKLTEIDGLTSKKMFGGHGIFHEEKMFGLISPDGTTFFKTDDELQAKYSSAGSVKHSKMPYYSVPKSVLHDGDELIEWATKAIEISK